MTSDKHISAEQTTKAKYRSRLHVLVDAVVHMDHDLWKFDPQLYELYSTPPDSSLEPHDQASHLQAIRLRALYGKWREKFGFHAHAKRAAEKNASAGYSADTTRPMDRMTDDRVEAAVLALTANFYHSITPEATALGVPTEGLLWAAMMHVDMFDKDYGAADMLRLAARAYELWKDGNSPDFEEDEHLQAFVLKLIDARVGEAFEDGWHGATSEFLEREHRMLAEFCYHVQVHGGHSPFGRAFRCGLPNSGMPSSVEEFRARVLDGVASFDRLVLETYIPF